MKGKTVFTESAMRAIRALVSKLRDVRGHAQKPIREKLRKVYGFRIQELMGARGPIAFTIADLDSLIRDGRVRVISD